MHEGEVDKGGRGKEEGRTCTCDNQQRWTSPFSFGCPFCTIYRQLRSSDTRWSCGQVETETDSTYGRGRDFNRSLVRLVGVTQVLVARLFPM